MFRTLKRFSFFITMLIFSVSANANFVELLSDDRKVQQFSDSGTVITTPNTPFAVFTNFYQNTTVSEAVFSGTGSGAGDSDFTFSIAESDFDITFAVDTTTQIDLSGDYSVDPGTFGFAEVTVDLYDGADTSTANVVYSDALSTDFGTSDASFEFLQDLPAGTYRLVIETNITPGGFGTEANYSFNAVFGGPFPDTDSDSFTDNEDNCILVFNPTQRDTDDDGYGNACDPDLNNDGVVNFTDISIWAQVFNTMNNGAEDFNGDGFVNFTDFIIMRNYFLQPPGPSALASGD